MEFHKKIEGTMTENEDWWSYLVEGDREVVVHGWNHLDSNNLKVSQGSKTYTVEEFMNGDHSIEAKNKLAAHLKTVKSTICEHT